ncbi:hypothetical protein Tco_0408546 [Tanacetum coccineum]
MLTSLKKTKDHPTSSKKCTTSSKPSKPDKSVQEDETVEVPDQEEVIDDEEPIVDEVVNTEEHPQDDVGLNHDRSKWFKQTPRPETLDPEWSKDPNTDVGPEHNWFHELEKTAKDQGEFDDLMVSTIDFSNFIKHRVKKDKIIKANLEGYVFKLLKGTYRNSIKLEYHLEQQFFFNNDLEYLTNGNKERKYAASVTKIKAARYDLKFIEDMIPRSRNAAKSRHDVFSHLQILGVIRLAINNQFGYGYLKEIVVGRADLNEYSFSEADFSRLHLNDIEDLFLLCVQRKIHNLMGEEIIHLINSLYMFTKSIVIQKRVEDVQLGVESYQTNINITKPQT